MVKKVMAKPAHCAVWRPGHQDRHHFIVKRNQGRLGIDVDDLQIEEVFVPISLQGRLHVVAQMAIAARI